MSFQELQPIATGPADPSANRVAIVSATKATLGPKVRPSEPCHRCVTHSWNQKDTEGQETTRSRVKLSTGGRWRKRRDTGDTMYAGFGTVRRLQADVLTAKLTAILSDVGNRQRMSADTD
jgi:hypothetical protein